jgi:hypothetical protein
MKLRHAYWLFCIPGLLLPYAVFVPWLLEHGLDIPLFVKELFATRVGAFFGCDVVVSAIVLIIFAWSEIRRLRLRLGWLTYVATMSVGVSLGLPLFLALRQAAIDAGEPA